MKKKKVLLALLLFVSAMCLYAESSKVYALMPDIYLSTGKSSDNPNTTSASFSGSTGSTDITDFNIIPDTLTSPSYTIKGSDLVGNSGGFGTTNVTPGITRDALSPLRWFRGTSDGDKIIVGPRGNTYNDFNPAVMAAPIAAQIGGYLTQLNSYDEAFRNMDMYMLMTKKQRQAMKNRNKYASSNSLLAFDPLNSPYESQALWARPYGSIETVELNHGPKVDNTAWGSFFGGDSELIELGNGWDGMFGVYAGYNGSHQSYDGISIYQNGGTLGLVGMAYKNDFFTGLTVNVGANVADSTSRYGDEDFTMLLSGIASKTGYNWELADGKFIIQPSWLMSYSFINTYDYTNAAGIGIDADALHALQLEPGLKFIGNLNNGWQPYAGVSVVWNIMDKTHFQASDATLPELSVKPFVKYGVGIRKTWGERLTGFAQTFLMGGGRNGVGIQAGVRWALGKSVIPKHANSTGEKKYIKADNTKSNQQTI